MKKRWGTLLLAGLLGTAVLSGCGSSASDSASTAAADSAAAETTTSSENTKEDLIFVNYRDIRDLNPHLYAGEMYAQEMLYEGLVNITADGFEAVLLRAGMSARTVRSTPSTSARACCSLTVRNVMPTLSRPTLTQFWKTRTATPGWR